jgi:hypothetical protein
MQATPRQCEEQNCGFAFVIFLCACACDVFKEAAFAAVEFIYIWTKQVALTEDARNVKSLRR